MRARDALVALAVAMAMLAGMELILRLLYRAPGSQISLRQVNEIAFQAHPDYLVTVRPNLQRRPFVRRTANGEVVNAPILRAELEAAGHQFQTHSDTEVVVHAYEEWGMEAFKRLRGMFAFGLWDGRSRQLILVRDRFGMKPLYYSQNGTQFAFASEIRPLFTLLPTLARQPRRSPVP